MIVDGNINRKQLCPVCDTTVVLGVTKALPNLPSKRKKIINKDRKEKESASKA